MNEQETRIFDNAYARARVYNMVYLAFWTEIIGRRSEGEYGIEDASNASKAALLAADNFIPYREHLREREKMQVEKT